MITDWLVHDAGHYATSSRLPPELAVELLARYPDDPVKPNDWGHSINANPERLLVAKRETLRRKAEFLSELLQSRPWNVCYAGFDECHEMSHLSGTCTIPPIRDISKCQARKPIGHDVDGVGRKR